MCDNFRIPEVYMLLAEILSNAMFQSFHDEIPDIKIMYLWNIYMIGL
jgi:hypothetical protein